MCIFQAPLEMAVQGRLAESLRKIPLFASIHENKPWSKLDLLGNLAEYEKVNISLLALLYIYIYIYIY